METKTEPEAGNVLNPFIYDEPIAKLDMFVFTGLVVAGKPAEVQQKKLRLFFRRICINEEHDEWTIGFAERPHSWVMEALEFVRMGQYTRISKGMEAYAAARVQGLDPRTCGREDLTAIPGIGMKTASFFLLFSRRDIKGIACLDTHILKFMREEMGIDAPKATPSGRKYLELEKQFVSYCEQLGVAVAEKDFEIWKRYRTKYK
jgi:hypothetical protein